MPTFRFLGRVYPRIGVFLSVPPTIALKVPSLNFEISATAYLYGSSFIEVICIANQYSDEVRNVSIELVYRWVHVLTDVIAFSTGIILQVILDRYLTPGAEVSVPLQFSGGEIRKFCTVLPGLHAVAGSGQWFKAYQETVNMIVADQRLSLAMRDLIESMATPDRRLVNCGRVVDAIRYLISPGVDRQTAWRLMHDALCLSKGFLEFVTEHSKLPRHGSGEYILPRERDEVLQRTWITMNRFLEFRKRGDSKLPANEFPQL